MATPTTATPRAAPSAPTKREIAEFVKTHELRGPSTLDGLARIGVILVGWIGLYFVGATLASPLAWVAIFAVQAVMFEGMGGAVHEAAHDKLFPRRWQNRTAGWLLSLPRLFNFPAYQISHLEHHRHTHDRDLDTEPVFERLGVVDYVLYMIGSSMAYSAILYYQGAMAMVGRGPRWFTTRSHRRQATAGTLVVTLEVLALAYGYVVAHDFVVYFWLTPFLLCNLVSSVVTKAEHFGCAFGPAPILSTTRTVYSNRPFAYFLWNNNLHTAHHLVPSLPGTALPKLQEYIDPHCEHTARSYARWHVEMLRANVSRLGASSAGTVGFWASYRNRLSRQGPNQEGRRAGPTNGQPGGARSTVRIATADDVTEVGRSLAAAFATDPVLAHVLPPGAPGRPERLARFMEIAASATLEDGRVLRGLGGAALWRSPGRWRDTPAHLAQHGVDLRRCLGARLPVGLRALNAVQSAHPEEAHWYLQVVGVEPSRQGAGLGAALLTPVLEECDVSGTPAYLEASRPELVGYYGRFGFRQIGELTLPDGGPPMWLLWREPRSSDSARSASERVRSSGRTGGDVAARSPGS